MNSLEDIVKNYINQEKRILIKRICSDEKAFLSKEDELIKKYVDCDENLPKKKIKLDTDEVENKNNDLFSNMDFLNNDKELPVTNLSEPEKEIEIDIESLNLRFKSMSLKQIQSLCQEKNISIHKTSKSSGKEINKTKKELIELLTGS